MSKPATDELVFALDLHVCSGGTAVYSVYTHWVDFDEDRRDIRAPSLLVPDLFRQTLDALGQKSITIRSEGQYNWWLQRRGWATVPKRIAYKLMPQWLKRHPCLKGLNGAYTALSFCAPNAAKHHAHRGKRQKVLQRDGNRCLDCGATEDDGAKLTMHHVEPYSRGYETTTRNLVTLCETCNQSRGDQGNRWDFSIRDIIRDFDLSLIGRTPSSEDIYLAMSISDNLMRASCEVY
jgi:hypothetical protein